MVFVNSEAEVPVDIEGGIIDAGPRSAFVSTSLPALRNAIRNS